MTANKGKELREALAELVACKDLHDQYERETDKPRLIDLKSEYDRRKPLAWAAARAALAEASIEQDARRLVLETLEGIVNAKRYDREIFPTDAEFIDWAQSRARHVIAALQEKQKENE